MDVNDNDDIADWDIVDNVNDDNEPDLVDDRRQKRDSSWKYKKPRRPRKKYGYGYGYGHRRHYYGYGYGKKRYYGYGRRHYYGHKKSSWH